MTKSVVATRIKESCDSLGQVELSGIALEEADPRLLDVTTFTLDKHVAMHPSAIAYYGMLLKNAAREMASMERAISRWEKKKWAEAKASLVNSPRSTVADIEARFIIDNEIEIEKHEKQLEELRAQYDALYIWFEAWKQKGFSLKEYAAIENEERWAEKTGNSLPDKNEKSNDRVPRTDRVRAIIRKNRITES